MMMKRAALALCTMTLVVSSVGAQTRIKIATMAPDGSFWMNEFQAAADLIDQRTDGRVSLRFYPGGTMGSDSAMLRKIRIGQLQGGVFLAGGLAEVDQNFDVYNLPLLFWSFSEVDYVRQRMDASLIDELAKSGLVAFGITETGFTYLMSAKPTRTFNDLRGRKAWAPQDDPISLAIVNAAGLSPVPLPISDVLTGLQTGLIDTVAAPAVAAIALQWFTKAPYITDLPITYVCGALAISEKTLEKLSPGDRKIVSEVLAAATGSIDRKTRADDQEARAALVKQGATFVDPTDETLAEWIEIAAKATQQLLAERAYDPKIVAEIQRLLAEYRASHPADE
ncbi:MAG: TRAP transporter substrate-binding protein DctP [Thermoanaerobaculales bacterium]|nr:TRAP transporter substrate-binding protein DctP [Thermoanaerobaculales bacterium]